MLSSIIELLNFGNNFRNHTQSVNNFFIDTCSNNNSSVSIETVVAESGYRWGLFSKVKVLDRVGEAATTISVITRTGKLSM